MVICTPNNLITLQGSNVRAKTKDGAEFEGLFHAATTTSELSVVLKLARKLDKSTQQAADADKTNPNPPIGSIIIPAKDLVEIYAANVKFDVATRQVVEKDCE
jgi:hypothetical protein